MAIRTARPNTGPFSLFFVLGSNRIAIDIKDKVDNGVLLKVRRGSNKECRFATRRKIDEPEEYRKGASDPLQGDFPRDRF
jgi:hypothetical protein